MFFDFIKFKERLHAVWQEEERVRTTEDSCRKVLEATCLSDVDSLTTEVLADAMLHMPDYVGNGERARIRVEHILKKAVDVRRVRTTRLL